MTEMVNLRIQENTRRYNLNTTEQIGAGGTKDYEKLKNKPSIESVELIGDKSFEDLGLRPLTNLEIDALLH